EGRFDTEIPASGADEFDHLARELDRLGREVREDRERAGGSRALHRAADLLGDGILTLGPHEEVILINSRACKWLGIDRATSQGRPLQELLPAGHPLLASSHELLSGNERTLSARLRASEGGDP